MKILTQNNSQEAKDKNKSERADNFFENKSIPTSISESKSYIEKVIQERRKEEEILKRKSEKILVKITQDAILEYYYTALVMVHHGYGHNTEQLKGSVGSVIYQGELTEKEVGELHICAYYYGASYYFTEGEDSYFYEYCDHRGIAKNITLDSTYEEFQKYVDHKKLGMDLLTYETGFCGEYFYSMDGHVFEVVDYDWLSEQEDSECIPNVIIACYEMVNLYIEKGEDLEDAVLLAYEEFNGEVA